MDIRNILFKNRGITPVPLVAYLLLRAKPSFLSLSVGSAVAMTGEWIRLWALSHIGPATRTRNVGAPALVKSGPYAMTRNPLYTGNILIAFGSAMAAGLSSFAFFAASLLGLQYTQIISLEEDRLMELFGDEYRRYKLNVPALIPGSEGMQRAWSQKADKHTMMKGIKGEWPTLLAIFTLFLILFFKIARSESR